MTTLTKSDRFVAIERILKKTFEPRFDELKRLLTEAVNKNIAEQFPEFLTLYADPTTRRHLHAHNKEYAKNGREYYDDRFYLLPQYAEVANTHLSAIPKAGSDGTIFTQLEVKHTSAMGGVFTVPGLVPLHDEIWDDLIRAASKLRETFFAYKSREAFTKDFPALAEYLPTKITVSSSTAVRLNPVDVMKDLAAMGIPPETEDEPACAEG